MKVLITGGGGFLGSHLGDGLLAAGHEVTALDTSPDLKVRHNLDNPHFRYIKGSIFDLDLLESLVRKSDLVYHLAAVVGVEHYVEDPFHVLNVNVNGTQNVLKFAHRYDKKLVFASTSEVYGKSKDAPFREDGDRLLGSTEIDRWCYSTSKAVGEHFCFAYLKLGLPVVIVRFFNVYGPRLDRIDVGRVITIFMGQLLRGEDLTVIGDGKQTRSFTYVDDAVQALVQAGVRPEAVGKVINIGNDTETSVLELAEAMIRAFPDAPKAGSKIKFVPQEKIYGTSYEDIQRRVPDITRMRTILGVDPTITLEDGLRRTIDWFRHDYENESVGGAGGEGQS
jgi:UDP-glucose 4-epimerase